MMVSLLAQSKISSTISLTIPINSLCPPAINNQNKQNKQQLVVKASAPVAWLILQKEISILGNCWSRMFC